MLRKQHRPRKQPDDETFRVIGQRGAARELRVVPKPDKPVAPRACWLFRNLPLTQRFVRSAIYWQLESRALGFVVNPKLMTLPMKLSRSYLEHSVKAFTSALA